MKTNRYLRALLILVLLTGGCLGCQLVKDYAKDAAIDGAEGVADKGDAYWNAKLKELGVDPVSFDSDKSGDLNVQEMAAFTIALNTANRQAPAESQIPWYILYLFGLAGGASTMTPSRRILARILAALIGAQVKPPVVPPSHPIEN